MKVGILYPRSGVYPLLGSDLVEGIKAALAHDKAGEVEFVQAPVGFGENEKEAYQQAERLLVYENVDVVVAFIDHKLSRLLDPLFLATGKLFIVVNPGANIPDNWTAPRTTIFVGLYNAFLCWLTGKQAVKNGHTRGALAVSFYDGGYLHCATFVNGFLQAGGEMKYNFIGSQRIEQFSIEPLLAGIHQTNANAILSLFSGKESVLFLTELARMHPEETGLYLSPMMLDEQLDIGNTGIRNYEGYVPWYSSLENEENKSFTGLVKRANLFSLLGWETALVLRRLQQHRGDATSFVQNLPGEAFNTPRGIARFDSETHYLLAPVYRNETKNGQTRYYTSINTESEWEDFTEREKEIRASGWNNTYLCY